jgi:hypothetical protein
MLSLKIHFDLQGLQNRKHVIVIYRVDQQVIGFPDWRICATPLAAPFQASLQIGFIHNFAFKQFIVKLNENQQNSLVSDIARVYLDNQFLDNELVLVFDVMVKILDTQICCLLI